VVLAVCASHVIGSGGLARLLACGSCSDSGIEGVLFTIPSSATAAAVVIVVARVAPTALARGVAASKARAIIVIVVVVNSSATSPRRCSCTALLLLLLARQLEAGCGSLGTTGLAIKPQP
jgi:hypothetical protein